MPAQAKENQTRLRLIKAAGEVFSRKGFRGGAVREICRKAGVNVAGVNYHFGGKRGLYLAVLEYAHAEAARRYPPDMGLPPDPGPEDRLRAFVRSLLHRTLGRGKPAWYGKLMARERFEPTGVMEDFTDRAILPRTRLLREIVAELLGPRADPETVLFCAQSVAGQCRHYYYAKNVLSRIAPDLAFDEAGLERIAEHVVRFSLAAMAAFRASIDHSPLSPHPCHAPGEAT